MVLRDTAASGWANNFHSNTIVWTIWNSYYFLVLYANIDGYMPLFRIDSENEMDVYIISNLSETLNQVTSAMDTYGIPEACEHIAAFMEILTNWYIRRNRRRFWKSESDSDKKDAYDTLYTVLTTVCRMAAPLLPNMKPKVAEA